jgi:hypothetical protein
MRRLLVLVALAVTGALLIPGNAMAQAIITIPINTVAHESGQLASAPVPADLQGLQCSVEATAENQSSVHPGNDLIVSSGSDSVTLSDVERAAGVTTTADGPLTLGTEVVVTLSLGPDGVFSGGLIVTIECGPTTTTTTPSETTTTTVPVTTTIPGGGGGGGGGTTTVPTTTASPTVAPTTVTPTTTTASPSVAPTTTRSPSVAPTTVSPGGTAFTGVENVVPIGAIALLLMTSGSGLLWAGSRRKRDQDRDEE